MRLLTKEQANRLDKVAIDDYGILGVTLMKNAGQGLANFVQSKLIKKDNAKIGVICGKGNNGGDGFAAASFLKDMDFNISIYSIAPIKEISRETGTPNPFLQAKGILNSMKGAFKGLSLYRDFPLTLEDFMPPSDTYDDQSSLQTPPLPNTPMPAKMAQNNQQKDPQTNLTRTQTALLSPTEKVIASKKI